MRVASCGAMLALALVAPGAGLRAEPMEREAVDWSAARPSASVAAWQRWLARRSLGWPLGGIYGCTDGCSDRDSDSDTPVTTPVDDDNGSGTSNTPVTGPVDDDDDNGSGT